MEVALLLFIPLIGSILSYLVGQTKPSLSGWIASAAAILAFIFTVIATITFVDSGPQKTVNLFEWFSAGGVVVNFSLLFDPLTSVMALVITGVGSLIHLYSIGYMSEDESQPRYFAYLNLFLFFMLLLVLADNLVLLFAGWEGVGLCSYLLIGFWFKNKDFAIAGQKAFIYNRIGDIGFLLGIFALFQAFGVLDFISLESEINASFGREFWLTIAGFGFFLAATGKSAQIPLYTWLPDAMAGPTPVSALIHAATMVTAGIYLFARLHYLFSGLPLVQEFVFYVALATSLLAALIALAQNDLKKVLAYSTVSQLGFMFMAVAAGAYWIAIFHVVTHAFFKACLFLSAGNIIHACHGEQDMRKMGGLQKELPVTFWSYLVATLSIAGIYPLAGYFSKHGIFAAVDISFGEPLMLFASLIAILTVIYMTRSLALVFFGEHRGSHTEFHKPSKMMDASVCLLAVFSFIGGMYGSALAAYLSFSTAEFEVPHVGAISSIISSILPLAILIAVIYLYINKKSLIDIISKKLGVFVQLAANKFYVDEIYHVLIVLPFRNIAKVFENFVDRGIIDTLVESTSAASCVTSLMLKKLQNGQLRVYTASMFFVTLILIYFTLLA